jgi:orotate phosphoribosyltransferase
MSLFRLGDFTLHSGSQSRWKIDCDALSPQDWEALAVMLVERLPAFGLVVGVPEGGLPLADALGKYADSVGPVLVVDDVLTTGRSMEEEREFLLKRYKPEDNLGAVVFARGPCPDWVYPLFRLGEKWPGPHVPLRQPVDPEELF